MSFYVRKYQFSGPCRSHCIIDMLIISVSTVWIGGRFLPFSGPGGGKKKKEFLGTFEAFTLSVSTAIVDNMSLKHLPTPVYELSLFKKKKYQNKPVEKYCTSANNTYIHCLFPVGNDIYHQ